MIDHTNISAGQTDVTAGLCERPVMARALKKSERAITRWEHAGMPVIRFGNTRLYDPTKVRAWLLTFERRHDVPKRGRPSKPAAA